MKPLQENIQPREGSLLGTPTLEKQANEEPTVKELKE